MKYDVILISGLPGSGSTTVSKKVAQRLGLDFFSPGQLFKDIESGCARVNQQYYNIFEEVCRKYDLNIPEKKFKKGEGYRATLDLWETKLGEGKRFHNAIDEVQRRLAERGNVVIDGKLSFFIIGDFALKVWLNASLEERSKRISQRDGVSLDEAQNIIKKRVYKERESWMGIYDIDYTNLHRKADLTIDANNLSLGDIVNTVVRVAGFGVKP